MASIITLKNEKATVILTDVNEDGVFSKGDRLETQTGRGADLKTTTDYNFTTAEVFGRYKIDYSRLPGTSFQNL
jgi:hypothetical protein